MYLTEEEFNLLKLIKKVSTGMEIDKRLNKKLCTNDPRINALFQKYGVDNRIDLINKAYIEKVEICKKRNIPYFEYDEMQLVKKIPVCKSDVKKLIEIFDKIQDEDKNFNLVYSRNTLDEYIYLEVQNNKEYVYERVG